LRGSFFDRYKAVLDKNEMFASLHKAYLMEAILVLESGDSIKSQQVFMSHLQNSEYLTTQDCKAEEDLITAVKNRDREALAEVSKGAGRLLIRRGGEERCSIQFVYAWFNPWFNP